MYKKLNEKERKEFIKKYFVEWGDDIRKVTMISYNGINEYLINDTVLFLEKDNSTK